MKRNIKLFVTDCDGCLTDGGMYYDELGNEFKKFNAKDGMGFEILRNNGILTSIITGEKTKIVERRAHKLKIDELYQGVKNKLEVLSIILKKNNIEFEEVAYVGDDINDIEAIKKCGLSFAPNDAIEQVKENVTIILQKAGGQGAIREAVEYIINIYNNE